jgi:site-specific DNA-methyltransferase (adenine-specific)
MKTIPDKHFSLSLVDPPYGIGIGTSVGGGKPFGNSGKGKFIEPKVYRGFNDSKTPEKKYFEELKRISCNQMIFGGNYFIEHLTNTPCMIVWDKDNSGNFADAELIWTSFSTSVRIFRFRWNGMLQENMKDKEERIHPTQKPVQLYKWLLKNYAKPGDTIFDSHLGSGSSRIACYEGGFDFVGCELDKEYFDAGNKRFENYRLQLKLF